jgi:hypothetical protein
MYVLEGNQIAHRPEGGIGRVIAEIPSNGDREQAALLVSKANLAGRDESLLDELGERIATRNES